MTGVTRTRVLIADDQALVRGGFRLILEAQQDIAWRNARRLYRLP